ncbi:Olfactory receptor 7C2 [Sciurus carolinensis]|uniref:Olfactory receptor 7C2 n=1 Tax=Sciurus carolinensis TaxID=30640 RepID=A0AA41NG62_SCICA|nr:Olfactory receptor 7C2 [Sciurus carolinensis]
MERGNQTGAGNFILLGFTDDPDLQSLLFGLLLSMYLVTVLGNLLIILATISDSHLHTPPMYFFLSNLSLADIGFTSTTIPKVLRNIQTHSRVISFAGCISQIYFFVLFACQDNLLLRVMAYDRFLAICHPCTMEIPHFFCDLPEVLKITCSDTLINNVLVYSVAIILAVFPLTGILLSYSQIFSSILRISSDRGKYKAFSTCGSHLLVVSLFYGTGLGVYLSSAASPSSRMSLMASVMYTMVTPMLNPFIYSLRNRDIKELSLRVSFLTLIWPADCLMVTDDRDLGNVHEDDPELQSLLFALLLSMYLVTVLGNLLIILTTISDSNLHKPMYFYLSNLSLADIGFISTTVPKALRNI